MTLFELLTSVQQKLGLDSTASSTEETMATRWINDGVIDLLVRARVNISESTMTTTANTADYTLDDEILVLNDMTYSNSSGTSQLIRTTPADILMMRTATPAVSGYVRYYALNGNDLLMLYPTPTSVDTITVWYVQRPTPLDTGSNDPSDEAYGGIPTEYHKAIELYALAEGAEFTDHQPSQFGALFRQQYEAKLVEIKRSMRHKGGRSLGNATLGRRKLIGANSQYPRP
jgi:hypothetical protein